MARCLMSDEQWEFFEAFIPAIRGPAGRPARDHRRIMDGIFWIARTGAPWRDLPEEFGKWATVYRPFRPGTRAGLWELILDALNQSGTVPDICKWSIAPSSAPITAPRAKRGTQKEDIGRSKGGFSTKIQLRTNAKGLPMKAELTPGQVSDYAGYEALWDVDLPPANLLVVDKGYDSDTIRQGIAATGGSAVIPHRRHRLEQQPIDDYIYALRNLIERCINRLKNARRLATRYDKTAASFLGFIHVVSARLWFRQLST